MCLLMNTPVYVVSALKYDWIYTQFTWGRTFLVAWILYVYLTLQCALLCKVTQKSYCVQRGFFPVKHVNGTAVAAWTHEVFIIEIQNHLTNCLQSSILKLSRGWSRQKIRPLLRPMSYIFTRKHVYTYIYVRYVWTKCVYYIDKCHTESNLAIFPNHK